MKNSLIECYDCGEKFPRSEMIRKQISEPTGYIDGTRATTKTRPIGWDGSAKFSNDRTAYDTISSGHTYYDIKHVWLCRGCAASRTTSNILKFLGKSLLQLFITALPLIFLLWLMISQAP